VRADDAPRLIELCRRLSPQSARRRFLRYPLPCDRREAERLANVDQVRRVALAVVADPTADGPILAVGRFHADSSDGRAELALLVGDEYQHVGLGRLLLKRLIHEAARRRLRVFDGYVLYDNTPMMRLLRTIGQPLEVHWDGGDVLKIELGLAVA
jgi:GNAT superfamily N-acetyltransferase